MFRVVRVSSFMSHGLKTLRRLGCGQGRKAKARLLVKVIGA